MLLRRRIMHEVMVKKLSNITNEIKTYLKSKYLVI